MLFCLYTNDCQVSSDQCTVIKCADGTVLALFLYDNDSFGIVAGVQKCAGLVQRNGNSLI